MSFFDVSKYFHAFFRYLLIIIRKNEAFQHGRARIAEKMQKKIKGRDPVSSFSLELQLTVSSIHTLFNILSSSLYLNMINQRTQIELTIVLRFGMADSPEMQAVQYKFC